MPFATDTRAPDGTRQFDSSLLEALHRSRQRQAMRMIAEYGHLLAAADMGMPPCLKPDVLQAESGVRDEQFRPVASGRLPSCP